MRELARSGYVKMPKNVARMQDSPSADWTKDIPPMLSVLRERGGRSLPVVIGMFTFPPVAAAQDAFVRGCLDQFAKETPTQLAPRVAVRSSRHCKLPCLSVPERTWQEQQ